MQTCASTDADIRTDRRRHTHRPTQTYAPTDADVRIDRCDIEIKLPLNKDVYTHTMLMLMAKYQKIAKPFDEDFWVIQ